MQTIEIPKWYCTNIHAGLKITLDSVTGGFKVSTCSRNPVTYPIVDDHVFDHPGLVKFRKDNIELHSLPTECKNLLCKFQNCSTKTASNDLYIRDSLIANATGPKLITFLVSTICNLACATCTPSVSSKWNAITLNKRKFASANPEHLRKLIKSIDISNLETVHIFGGEPFADSINNIILEELVEYGSNITIWYDTNGTFIPNDQTLKLWDKFRLVRLKFSIDGVDESFEYMRWPAKWNHVNTNIATIKQTAPSNVMFSIRPAMGLLNLHKIKDIRDWFTSELPTNREGDLSELEYNGVYGIFSAENITTRMKDDLLEMYDMQDPIMQIISHWSGEPDAAIIHEVQQNLARIDSVRGTDYKKSLPYLTDYF